MTERKDPTVFLTMSSYVVGRLYGVRRGGALLLHWLQHPESPEVNYIPALRSINLLRELVPEIEVRLDTGTTNVSKSISRHFYAALRSDADVWISIDDDSETTIEVLAWTLAAVDSPEPRICVAPFILRDSEGVACIEWSEIYSTREVNHPQFPGGIVRRAKRGGFGLVACNRAAMNKLAEHVGPTWFDNTDARNKYPVAYQLMDNEPYRGTGCLWHGSDFSFFIKAREAGIEIEGLVTGETMHASYGLDLSKLNRQT